MTETDPTIPRLGTEGTPVSGGLCSLPVKLTDDTRIFGPPGLSVVSRHEEISGEGGGGCPVGEVVGKVQEGVGSGTRDREGER